MEILNRRDIEFINSHLSLEILEAAIVKFKLQCQNCQLYNRIFIPLQGEGGRFYNHTLKQAITMVPGNIYFMPANIDLEFDFSDKQRFISIHYIFELFNGFSVYADTRTCSTINDDFAFAQRLKAAIWEEKGITATASVKGITYELAGRFLANDVLDLKKLKHIQEKYSTLFTYIKEKATARTGIDELAEICNIPRDSLSRMFPKDCGVTLKDYLTKQLVIKAEALLLSSGASARSTSEALQFSSEYYFSRFFKKHTGQTTGSFIKQARDKKLI